MGRVILTFSSTHAAMAAEDALREAGVSLEIIPLPEWVAAHCGLAIRLDEAAAQDAEADLRRRGIGLARVLPDRD